MTIALRDRVAALMKKGQTQEQIVASSLTATTTPRCRSQERPAIDSLDSSTQSSAGIVSSR
jgi:hypothetical protein